MKLPPWQVHRPENRRAVVEIGGNINGLPIPEEGTYEFVVSWNGDDIFQRRLHATKISMKKPPKGSEENNFEGDTNL